jgi:hypothetical protein
MHKKVQQVDVPVQPCVMEIHLAIWTTKITDQGVTE